MGYHGAHATKAWLSKVDVKTCLRCKTDPERSIARSRIFVDWCMAWLNRQRVDASCGSASKIVNNRKKA